jgi:hypothetical protein
MRNVKCNGFSVAFERKAECRDFPMAVMLAFLIIRKKECLTKIFIVSKVSCHIIVPPDPAFSETNVGSNSSDGHFFYFLF